MVGSNHMLIPSLSRVARRSLGRFGFLSPVGCVAFQFREVEDETPAAGPAGRATAGELRAVATLADLIRTAEVVEGDPHLPTISFFGCIRGPDGTPVPGATVILRGFD